MKLLVVTQYFSPENFRINDLVCGFVANGHEVTVLTAQPNYPTGRFFQGYGWFGKCTERIFGADVLRVPIVARGKGGALRLSLNYFSFVVFATLAVLMRLRGRFDAVFVFEPSPVTVGIPAIVASRRFKAPILFWVLDLWPESLSATGALRSPFLIRIVGLVVKWIYARCNQVLVQSRAFIPSVMALGVMPSRIKYFPNWIESEYIQPATSPYDNYEDEIASDFRIIFAGNIGVAQDFPSILVAAEIVSKQMPHVQWVIAGEGRMAAWVRAEVERISLAERFIFLGQLPSHEMPALFTTADALLVCLRNDPVFSLTIPGKVQSYMSAGKPLLAMLDGEGARIIEDADCGLTCSAGNAQALAAHVLQLANMKAEDRKLVGNRGLDYAKREFGRDLLFGKLEGWIAEAIEECKKG